MLKRADSSGSDALSEEIRSLPTDELPKSIAEDESDGDDNSAHGGLEKVTEMVSNSSPSDVTSLDTEKGADTTKSTSASAAAPGNPSRVSKRLSVLATSAVRHSLSAIQSIASPNASFSPDAKHDSIGMSELASGDNSQSVPRRTSRRSFIHDASNEPMMQKLEAAGFRGSVASEAMMITPAASMSRWQRMKMQLRIARLHLWLFLEEPWMTRKACIVSSAMVLIIIASVLNAVAMSRPRASDDGTGLSTAEWPGIFFNVIFCLDLLLRFWAFPQRCRFLSTPKNMVDFMSVLPFFVNKVCGLSLHVDALDFLSWLNAYEAFLRLVKLSRYFWGWQLLFRAVCDSIKALVIPVYFLLIMVFFGSCTLYVVENMEEARQMESGFYDPLETNIYRKAELGMVTVRSLSDAIHFSTICILSMSAGAHYGLQAASAMGQVTAGCLMAFGMLFMAMPIAIVGSVFSQTWFDQDRIVLLEKVRSRLRAQGYKWEDCEEVFDEVDKDRSGEIELHEFKKMLKSFHIEGLSRAKCQRLYRYFDLDGDGVINYYDFAGTLFPEIPLEKDEEDDDSDSSSSSDGEEMTHRDSNVTGNHSLKDRHGEDNKIKTTFLGIMKSLSANPSRAGSAVNSRRGSLALPGNKRGSAQKRCSAGSAKDTDSAGCLSSESFGPGDAVSRQASVRSGLPRPDRGSINSNASLPMKDDPFASIASCNSSFVVKEDSLHTARKSLDSCRRSLDSGITMSHLPPGEPCYQAPKISNAFVLQLEAILTRMDSNISRLMRMTEKKNIQENTQPQVMSVFGPAPTAQSRMGSRRPSLSTQLEKPVKVSHSRRPSIQHGVAPLRGLTTALDGTAGRDSSSSHALPLSARRPSVSSVAGPAGRGFGILPGMPASPAPFMPFFNPKS